MNNVKLINLGFSSADAENISFQQINNDLVLTFDNWQEQQITLTCKHLIAVKFQTAEFYFDKNERDDSTYIIENSEWLETHRSQNILDETKDYNHFKLNFNAEGIFEIICSEIIRN